GQALAVGVQEAAHVEMNIAAPQRAIPQQELVSNSILGTDAEGSFDGARGQFDYLRDAQQKLRAGPLLGKTLIALTGDQARGIPLGEEDEIRIKGAAVGANANDPAVVPDQALHSRVANESYAM